MKTINKDKIILIPGSGFNELSWQFQIKHLKNVLDLQVYIPNHNSLDKIIDDLLSKYKGNLHLVGHSYGGWVALATAGKATGKDKARIKSVISMDHVIQADDITRNALQGGIDLIKSGKSQEFKDGFRTFCVGEIGPDLDLVIDIVKKMQDQMSDAQLTRQLEAILNDMDITKLLPKITAKTLVLYFNGDNFFPNMDVANLIHKLVPNSQITVIENTGHMAPIQASRAISALIRLWCV